MHYLSRDIKLSEDEMRDHFGEFNAALHAAIGTDSHYAVSSTQQQILLENELERVYCSAAYLATICMAAAMAESHLAFWEIHKKDNVLFESLNISSEYEEIRKLRNKIMHYVPKNPPLQGKEELNSTEHLRSKALRALQIGLYIRYTLIRECRSEW